LQALLFELAARTQGGVLERLESIEHPGFAIKMAVGDVLEKQLDLFFRLTIRQDHVFDFRQRVRPRQRD